MAMTGRMENDAAREELQRPFGHLKPLQAKAKSPVQHQLQEERLLLHRKGIQTVMLHLSRGRQKCLARRARSNPKTTNSLLRLRSTLQTVMPSHQHPLLQQIGRIVVNPEAHLASHNMTALHQVNQVSLLLMSQQKDPTLLRQSISTPCNNHFPLKNALALLRRRILIRHRTDGTSNKHQAIGVFLSKQISRRCCDTLAPIGMELQSG
jgi:hypothetical protein